MILMNNMIGVGAILAQAGDIVAFAASKAGDDFVQLTSRR